MNEFFQKLLETSDWPPRWHCGVWTEFHGWLYIISDLLIWAAYFSIPLVILKYIVRKSHTRFFKLYILFAAFILACGGTHFLDAVAFWFPLYRLSALMRFITAVVSWVTVFYLVKYLPVAFSLKSVEELNYEVEQRKKAEAKVLYLNKQLEGLLQERTNSWKDSLKETADYKYALDESSIVAITDQHGLIKHVNENFCKISKYSREELIGKDHRIINSGHHSKEYISTLWKTIKEGKIWKGELKNKAKDGTIYWVDTTIVPFLNDQSEPYQFIAIRADITERKRVEAEVYELNAELDQKVLTRTDELLQSKNLLAQTLERVSFLASIADNIQDPVITSDNNSNITRWNAAAESLLEWKSEEAIGRVATEILKIIYPDQTREEILASFTEKGYWQGEVIYHTKSGKPVNVLATASKLKDAQGNLTGNLILARDISLRKKAEAKVIESEQLFSTIFHDSPVMNAISEVSTGKYLRVNNTFANFLERPREELLGKTSIELNMILSPDERARFLKQLQTEGSVRDIEMQVNTARGERRWVSINSDKINLGGKDCFLSAVIDITARKEAEVELVKLNEELEQRVLERTTQIQENETRFRVLVENNEDIISLTDEALNTVYRSPSNERITGWTPEDLKVKGGFTYFHPNDIIIIKTAIAEAVKNPGIPQPHLTRYLHKNGHYIWLEGTATKLPDDSTVKGIVFNSSDATERIELKRLLHKSNALARIGSWEVDLIKGTVFWSEITREIHETEPGYIPDLATGINFYKEGIGRDLIKQKVQDAIESGTPWNIELQIVTAKNNERWIRTIGEAEFADEKCVRIYGSFQDITERKHAEIERERLNERLQLAAQSAQLGLWDWDIKNNKLIWDEAMYRLYNLTENEFTTVYDGWASRVHDEDRQRVDNDIQLALAGEKDYNPEFRIVWPDSSVHYINASGIIERDHDGNAVRMTGFNWDVTERKKAEEEINSLNIELEQKVIQRTEQLEAANKEMEAFSYSVSHDLRAPLRAINGYATMLEEDYNSIFDKNGKRLLSTIQKNAAQMGALIDDLLSLSRLGRKEIQKSRVDMEGLAKVVVDELMKGFASSAKVKIDRLHVALADASLIKQVLMNIISNAIKYSSKSENPFIEISSIKEDDKIIYSVKDNGSGFDMAYSNKLFGVFQRLHSQEEFEGTGVGLALVKLIIDKHEGKIWAKGKVGEGAIFHFSLPSS